MLKIDKTQRDSEALRMRAAGASYEAIAAEIGLSVSGAWKSVQSALRSIMTESVTELRTLEGERLDMMQAGIWAKAVSGDTTAIGCVLRIMERRARLLGLDAPVKVAPTDPTGESAYSLPSISDAELIRWAQEHGVTVDSEEDSETES